MDRSTQLEEGSCVPVATSFLYTQKDYWDARFEQEEDKEWLASFADLRDALAAWIPFEARVLLVGVGTSRLGVEMSLNGWRNVVCTDYSAVVIDKQRKRWEGKAACRWAVADMLHLHRDLADMLPFDVVLDKAAIDALLADGGDSWQPPPALLDTAARVCAEVRKVLVPDGLYLQVTYSLPHFRLRYLLQPEVQHAGLAAAAAPADAPEPDAAPASAAAAEDEEWEPETPASAAASGMAGRWPEEMRSLLAASPWESVEQLTIATGFGYQLFVLKKKPGAS